MRSRPQPPTGGFVQRVEEADKVLSFAKHILVALAGILLWAARLQWNVADLQRQSTETNQRVVAIETDRKEHIESAATWRQDVEKANVKRDLELEQLTAIAKAQSEKPARAGR